MPYLPTRLNIKDKDCLVVGAGSVAIRKIKSLLECGAKVTVVSPSANKVFQRFAKNKNIIYRRKVFSENDLKGKFLIIAATFNKEKNLYISKCARRYKILINVVDNRNESDIIFPAYFRQGDLTISVSTDGVSPALAKKIKEDISKTYNKEYKRFLKFLSAYRKKIIDNIHSVRIRRRLFDKLTSPSVIKLVRSKKAKDIKEKLEEFYNQYAHTYIRIKP